jgi:hypothetical protein
MMRLVCILVLIISFSCLLEAFTVFKHAISPRLRSSLLQSTSKPISDEEFNPKDFLKVLKEGSPMVNSSTAAPKINVIDDLGRADQTYRKYPYENLGLPMLADCNNYYSGDYGDFFWHQNADQLIGYYLLKDPSSISPKADIHADFQAQRIKFTVKDEVIFDVELFDKIIPDGSFWLLEKDSSGKTYVQLDLEKRFRMINWNGFLMNKARADPKNTDQSKNEMLNKLFSANKGISKLTGERAETMEEMLGNEELMRRIMSEVDTKPRISAMDGSPDDEPFDMEALQKQIEGMNSFTRDDLEPLTVDTTIDDDANSGSSTDQAFDMDRFQQQIEESSFRQDSESSPSVDTTIDAEVVDAGNSE